MAYLKKNYNFISTSKIPSGIKIIRMLVDNPAVELGKPKTHIYEWNDSKNRDFEVTWNIIRYDISEPITVINDDAYKQLYNSVNSKYLTGFPDSLVSFQKKLAVSIKKLNGDKGSGISKLSIENVGFAFKHQPYFLDFEKNYDVCYIITVKLSDNASFYFILNSYGVGGAPFSQGDVNVPPKP